MVHDNLKRIVFCVEFFKSIRSHNCMKNILIIMLSAVAMIAGVEAKPVEHPVMHPIAHPTNPELEKPKFHGKRHGHKHHVRPHGKRCYKNAVKPEMKKHRRCKKMSPRPVRKPMVDAPIVRPVRRVNIHR